MDPAAESPVEVLVVDDQERWRELLRDVVAATPGLTVVGEAPSGEASLESVAQLAPRMVIMDVRMPSMGGVEATRRLKASHPDIVVVLVSVDGKDVDGLGSCGAAVFLSKQQLSPQGLGAAWQEHGAGGAQTA